MSRHLHLARFLITLSLFTGLLCAVSVPALQAQFFSQDMTLKEKVSTTGMPGGAGNQERSATVYLTPKAMKRSDEVSDSIIRFDESKMITVDHQKKTYTEITFEQLQQKLDKMGSDINKEYSGDQQKQAMEAMKKMFGGGTDQISVAALGPGEKIAGYNTQKYKVSMGVMEMEMWAAPELKFPPVYYDTMRLRMPKMPMFDMGKLYEEFKKINGYPLKQIMHMNMMGMKMITTTEVISVDKSAIPASAFNIPAGYTAAPMPF